MTLPATETGPRTYKVEELAKILQLRPATVRANARSGAWPYLKFGERTMRFTEAHLATILTVAEATPPLPRTTRRRTRRPSL
ncbi:hypothetical protein ABH924_004960 [Arthrobacter sp. GAS37]|uniref:hypothetical protein n=1 Tax=Arthrobacter sp. GAS37 TaxID=3156261 RepID=UPI0038381268